MKNNLSLFKLFQESMKLACWTWIRKSVKWEIVVTDSLTRSHEQVTLVMYVIKANNLCDWQHRDLGTSTHTKHPKNSTERDYIKNILIQLRLPFRARFYSSVSFITWISIEASRSVLFYRSEYICSRIHHIISNLSSNSFPLAGV